MLLWITDTAGQQHETDELIIRSPGQISAISPDSPTFVVIDIRCPVPAVMNWASKRQQATLWWRPVTDVPAAHCYVEVPECSAAEFIPLLSDIYHRNGVINVAPSELESVVNTYRVAQVFFAPIENGRLLNHQCWPLGYVIHRDGNGSLDDFQRVTERVKIRFKIKAINCLIVPDDGNNLLVTFGETCV
ncbi:hypothetical protein [Photobacterium sanguinicancri]|uniref:hypothetical protein n=1 Tax=Photobacterium sanguinicancri TaxID=875932 RepID=UPI0026E2B575|nr:hypothetical protein [Photobacterium sanguinicancri]MDO6499602.1 hypothetical protein [Photobacterium sanguinicancri]